MEEDSARVWNDLAAGRGGISDVGLEGLGRIETAMRERAGHVIPGPLPVELAQAFHQVGEVARLLRSKMEAAARMVQGARKAQDLERAPLSIRKIDHPWPTLADPLPPLSTPGETIFTVHAGQPFELELQGGVVVTMTSTEDGVFAVRGATLRPRPPVD